MRTLISNTKILMPDFSVIENGEIFIDNSTILYVGEKYKGTLVPDKVINAEDGLSMPGFINGHTHSAMVLMRNMSDNKNLHDWLYKDIIPMESKMSKDDVYNGTILAIAEYLRSGITTFCDLYYYAEEISRAIVKTGIRGSVGIGYHPNDTRDRVEIEKQYKNISSISDRVNVCFYVHSLYGCDINQYEDILGLSKKYNLPVHTHVAETLLEVGEIASKNNDKTPIQLLEEIGFFDHNSMVAHCVHVDSKDIKILKNNNVNVITNPSSNLKLGSGIAPIYKMHKEGINIAIGTDGAASNNSYNFFKEMYLTSVLQKGVMNDASALNSKEILKMATINMARALGLKNIGAIQQGYKADIVIVGLNDINMLPNNDILSSIVYSGEPINVKMTMVDGKVLYKDNEYFINESIDDIIYKIKKGR